MQVEEFSGENFHFSRTYLDIPRSDDFVVLQLTVSNTRTLAKKQALYRSCAISPRSLDCVLKTSS